MLAPKYIPTHLQTVHHDQDFTKHQKKLAQIQSEDRKRKVVDKEGPAKAKLFETREKNLKFHNSEKLIAIEKDNETLLGRLVEISRKKGALASNLSKSANLQKTLNGPSRQREKDRIALENEAFAKRLLSQQALFNRKKLELDYGKHQSLVKQMQRLGNPSTRQVKLPPISKDKRSHPTEDEKEDLAEEEERREKEETEKKEKEAKEKEDKERKEKEEKEKHEKEEKEKKEKEEAEKLQKEKAEKEKKEKEEKEKKEKEEKEKKEKEEKEKKEKEEAEKLQKEKTDKKEEKDEKDEKEEKNENEAKPKETTGVPQEKVEAPKEQLPEKKEQVKEEGERSQ